MQASNTVDSPPVFGNQPRTLTEVNQTYEFLYNASDPDGDPITNSLSGTIPAGLTFNAAAGSLTGTPTVTGSYPLVATINDGRGGSSIMSFTLVVTAEALLNPPSGTPADIPPHITSTPPAGGRVNVAYSYYAVASDPQNNVLHWAVTSGPVGAVIDPATGHLLYTPPPAALDQTISITILVFDDYGGSDTQTITLPITGNHPPEIVSTPPSAAQGKPWTYAVHGVDVDNNPLSWSLAAPTLTGGQLDPRSEGAAINPTTGVLTWLPQTTGTYVFNIQVSDGQGDITPQIFTITPAAAVHNPPQIRSSPGLVAVANSQYSYQVVALDPDGNTLTYAISDTSGQARISSSGLVTWTPTTSNVGQPENVTITVSDAFLSATQTYGIAVHPADIPPRLTASTFTVIEGQVLDADLTATDMNAGDSLTYSFASTPPSGLTLNATTGHLHWSVPYKLVTANTNYTVQVTATDGAGNSDTETETITVLYDTTPPVVVLTPASESVVVNLPVLFQVSTSDSVPVLSVTLTASNGAVISLRADGSGTYTPTTTGTLTFTATATDANGLSATTTTTLTVTPPPVPPAALPIVTLTGVSGTISQPTTISGTVATTTTSGNITSWLLEYSADGVNWYTAASATGLSLTGSNNITPTFDPTTLADGAYTLRLSATAAAGGTSLYAYIHVSVGGTLKVGNLTLTTTDMTIPVAGIPITITRVYNSLNAGSQEDFGYGWKLDLGGYTLSADQSTLDEFGGFQRGSRIYLTDSSGNTEGYTFEPYEYESFGSDWVPYLQPDANDTDTSRRQLATCSNRSTMGRPS